MVSPRDDLSGRTTGRPLGVQGVLQDDHRRGLVDHGPPLRALLAPVAQHSLRRHGGQTLVAAAAPAPARPERRARRANSRTFTAAGPSPPDSDRGSPTTTSTRLLLARPAARAGRGRPRRGDGLDRGRQEPGRVAAGDPDPGVAGVDPEAYAGPHRPAQAPVAARPTACSHRGQRLVDAATRRCRRPGRRRPCRRRCRRRSGVTAADQRRSPRAPRRGPRR